MSALMDVKAFSSDKSEIKSIILFLTENGLCPRCILRHLGETNPSVFRSSTKEINERLASLIKDEQEYVIPTLPCPACLGILQIYLDDEFRKKIVDTVVSNDFQYETFICSLTTPVCMILRERYYLLLLQEKFQSLYEYKMPEDILSVKEVWKLRNGPILASALQAPFDQKSKFDIILNFTYDNSDRECSFLSAYSPEVFRKRKNKQKNYGDTYTRANVTRVLSDITDGYFKRNYRVPAITTSCLCKCDKIECSYDAVFIAGRYNKYSRTLSQTPWMCDGGRKSQSSVEEEICGVLKENFKYSEGRFSSSGREDVDVRMLGSGRPFVIEMVNPHRVTFSKEEIAAMQKEINKRSTDVKVRDLQVVLKNDVNKLKEGEIEKTKSYTALCWSQEPLSQEQLDKLQQIKDLVLHQKTPIRVLHRRPLATRERTVYNMSAQKEDNFHFRLTLSTQAGTYIKEFVHGDFGRTKPNLGILTGVDCDILELDVQNVELDWPPSLGEDS